MPRIRSVKPEFWADEGIAQLPRDGRLLLLGMFNFADDHGRMRGNPLLIKSQVFPYDSDIDVEALLVVLASPREGSKPSFIRRYVVDGESFILIRNFTKHQKIDHPSKPVFPEPPQEITETLASPREPSRATDDASRKISLDQGAGSREQGVDQKALSAPPTAPAEVLPLLSGKQTSDADRVFEEWRRVMGKSPQTLFTPERRRKVEARLKDYSVDRLFKAIRGCKASPHHQGENPNGAIYDDLELICRDGRHVEQFEAFASRPAGAPVGAGKRAPGQAGGSRPVASAADFDAAEAEYQERLRRESGA